MGNDVEYILRIVLRARDEMVAVFAKARAELKGFTSDVKKFDESLGGLNSRITGLNRRVGNVDDKFKAWRTTLRDFVGEGDDADNSLKRLDNILDHIGGTTIRASRGQRDYARSTKDSNRESDKQAGILRSVAGAFGNAGSSAASFGNEMRGIAIVFAAAFTQQLITALIGLGGQLVATASSAAMAGAAIGGIFAAGIAQAIPVVGLLAGALSRVKAVMDTVQQATKLQQAQSVAQFQAGRKEADSTNQIANAQDSLRDALRNVGEAQDNLTQVRSQAIRNLHDMILAEKEAELAARGAALSQRDAQEALQVAIRTGGDVAQAQQRVEEANLAAARTRREARRQAVDVPRAQARGVQGQPDVQAATRQVENAERAVTRASRGLEDARRNANEAVAGTQTAAANLNYLLSQLSPAERKLYEAVRRVQNTWKTTWTGAGGIIEPIIDSFSGGVDRINTLMQMPSVLRTARSLSTEIGKQFTNLTDAFTSDKIVAQFNRIAGESKKNLGPIEGIVEDLGEAFLNIAEGAGPSFRRFLEYVGDLADKFLGITEDRDKVEDFFNLAEEHLESWINLALAVGNLFLAISGAGGAEAGKKGIDDLTGSINDMAENIRDSSDAVGQFFEDARDATDAVISVLSTVAEEVFKSFSPEHLQNFADVLNNIVIPAIGDAVRAISTFSDLVAQLLDIPIVGEIAKWGLTFAAFAYVGGSAGKTLLSFGGNFAKLVGIVIRLAPLLGRAIYAAVGPWGIAIGVVIAAIILLDRKFHFLEPTFRWLKGAFGDVLDWLKTHWPLVLTILTGPFGLAVTIIAKNWTTIKRGVTGAFNAIVDLFHDGGGKIGGALRAIGRLILRYSPAGILGRMGVNMAKALWNKFGDSIVDFFSGIGSWLFRHIIKPIYEFFEIKSPSEKMKRIGKQIADGFVEGFKAIPHLLGDAIHAMGDALESIGKRIANAVWEGIKKGPKGVAKIITSGIDLVFAEGGPVPGSGSGDTVPALLEPGEHVLTKREVAAAGGHAAIFALRAMLGGGGQAGGGRYQTGGRVAGGGGLTIAFEGGNLDDFKSQWRSFWRTLVAQARDGTADIQTEFRQMRVATTASADRMYRDVRGSIADIQNSFKVRGGNIIESWDDVWNNVSGIAYRGLFYVAHETNRALHGLSEKTISFGLTAPPARHQRGGMIPGWGDGDRVPVLAEPGEGFINKRAVKALGGPGVIDAINSMVPRFATGGIVPIPGMPGESISSSILGDVVKLIKQYKLMVYDGFGGSPPHAPNSDHKWGGAIDVGPGPGGSWDLVTKLAHWAEPKQNQPRRPFRWVGYDGDPGHGVGNHLHLSWMRGEHLGNIGEFVTKIARRIITGPDGGLKTFVQGTIDKVLGVANKHLDNAFGATSEGLEPGKDAKIGSVGAGAANIFRFFKSQGFTDEQAAGWIGNLTQESGLNPGAIQAGGPGRGLVQWGGGRFQALQEFASSHGKPWQDLGTQLAFIMHELHGSESAAYGAIKGAKTVDEAVAAIGHSYERFGVAGERNAPAHAAFDAFHGKYAEGGVVPGGHGKPVSILAHAGEWVLNPGQQKRIADLLGVSRGAIAGMLGFHGGKGSFQGGGEIEAPRGPLQGFHLKPLVDKELQDAFVELRRLTTKLAQDLRSGSVGKFVDNLQQILGRRGDLTIASQKLAGVSRADRRRGVDAFIKVVDGLLSEGGLFAKMRAAVEVGQARAARALSRRRFFVGEGRQIFERQDAVGQATGELAEQRRLRGDLVDEQTAAARALRLIRRQQRRGGLTQEQRQRLQGQADQAQTALSEAQQRVADNIAAIFEAQQALLAARLEAQQKIVDNISRIAERNRAWQDFGRRIASVFGDEGTLAQLAAAGRASLSDEADRLNAQIAGFRAIGSEEANRAADDLEDKVQDLRVQIVESIAQELADTASRIQEHAQRRAGRLDLFGRLLAATGVVGRTAAVSLGGETFSAAGVAQQQQANTLNQIAQTQDLLNRVQREQPQNVKLIQDLTDNLAELSVTLQEQQRAAFQARVEDVNSRSDFTLGINDLNKQVLELTGQISGNADQTGLLKLANERQAILTAKGNELQALYNEAVSKQDQQAINDLQTALLQNQVAMLQNTQAINELTGASKDPQTFASSAWTQFREAIFTGMGQILPQFDFSPMGTSAMNIAGAVGTSSSVSTTTGGDTNITVNEAGGPVDTTEISAAVAFARKAFQ